MPVLMNQNDIFKLQLLRAKTDRQLAQLVRARLEQAPGDERARREVCAWLPLLPAPDRAPLEQILSEQDGRSYSAICQTAGA